MNPRILGIMATPHGLITRKQAVAAGMSPERIDQFVRQGDLVVVRRGVYAEKAYVESLTTYRDKRLLADRAASMRISMPHQMSHESAAFELGLRAGVVAVDAARRVGVTLIELDAELGLMWSCHA